MRHFFGLCITIEINEVRTDGADAGAKPKLGEAAARISVNVEIYRRI
jgi:hypothetical protein